MRFDRELDGFWATVSDCAFNALSGEGVHSERTDWEEREPSKGAEDDQGDHQEAVR